MRSPVVDAARQPLRESKLHHRPLFGALSGLFLVACSAQEVPSARSLTVAAPSPDVQVTVEVAGSTVAVHAIIPSKGRNDTDLISEVADVAQKTAEALQNPSAPISATSAETVGITAETIAYDRLGNESVVPLTKISFAGSDLRNAKLANLSRGAVLELAKSYEPANKNAYEALWRYCAISYAPEVGPGLCARVFRACAKERQRVGGRIIPTCPATDVDASQD